MLRSDEILNSLNAKIEQAETCVDLVEKEELINQAVELKKEYKTALEDEAVEIREIENKNMKGEENKMEQNRVQMEREQFLNYVKGIKNEGMKAGEHGVLIPETVADRIIQKIVEISPVVARMTIIHEGGDLVFVREESEIPVGYQEEMVAFTGGNPAFATVKLESHLIGALAKVSKSLINRSSFDVVGFVEEALAKRVAAFLEDKALNGDDKIRGLADAKEMFVNKIDCDAIIDALMAIPQVHQAKAVLVMNPKTLAGLRKAKDGQGGYLLNHDARMAFGMEIFGKEVLVSEAMPEGEMIVGDIAGCYCKIAQKAEVEVLRERFADQYALGLIAYAEVDMKVVEPQALVRIKVTA